MLFDESVLGIIFHLRLLIKQPLEYHRLTSVVTTRNDVYNVAHSNVIGSTVVVGNSFL